MKTQKDEKMKTQKQRNKMVMITTCEHIKYNIDTSDGASIYMVILRGGEWAYDPIAKKRIFLRDREYFQSSVRAVYAPDGSTLDTVTELTSLGKNIYRTKMSDL